MLPRLRGFSPDLATKLAAGLAALFALPVATQAQEDRSFFHDGASIVWIGDSITHACLFTRYLEDYAWTRYPERALEFHNAGVSGDILNNVHLRFEHDIAPQKPTRVLISFGMNDAGFSRFNPEYLVNYVRSYRKLLDRCDELGALATLMTAPPSDDRSELARRGGLQRVDLPDDYGTTLLRFADATRRLAVDRSCTFIDLHKPLRLYRDRLRLINPGATLSPDGIHPSAATSALIASQVLQQLGERGPRLRIFAGELKPRVEGGTLIPKNFPEANRFEIRAESLPWPLPLEARQALLLDDYFAQRNRVFVRHETLEPGIWELRVDGIPILRSTAAEWSRGIDIGLRTDHPDWQQALRLSEINGLRNSQIRDGIRALWESRRIVAADAAKMGGAATQRSSAQSRMEQLRANLDQINKDVARARSEIQSLRSSRPRLYEWFRIPE
jgi:lysophospholipase L1-like esterase/predicted transcriptional regulator